MNKQSFATKVKNISYAENNRDSLSTLQPLLVKNSTMQIEEGQEEKDIKRLLHDGLTNQLYYGSEQFLNRPDSATSQEFLDHVTYQVDLSQLYKIVDTCYVNSTMPYCPILVENKEQALKHNSSRYLLQVWDNKSELIYQRELHDKPIAWFVTFNTLIYLPHESDQVQNENCYYIVFLYKQNCMIKLDVTGQEFGEIEDPIIGYCNKCLYISSQSTIWIISTVQTKQLGPGEVELVNDFKNEIRKPYKLELGQVKNHGFLINTQKTADQFLIICCETSDHQIDFSMLTYKVTERSYQIMQIQEVVSRELGQQDTIVQFKAIYFDEWPYAIVRRASGQVDFYWNYLRINNSQGQQDSLLKDKFIDVEVNFEGFYLRELIGNKIKKIGLHWQERIGLDVVESLNSKNLHTFQTLFQQKITDKVNFYPTSCLINTSFIIVHNDRIYIYDIINKEWAHNSFQCNKQVRKVFRNEKSPGIYNVVVLLLDGTFEMIDNEDTMSFSPEMWKHHQINNCKLEGTPISLVHDYKNYRMMYALTKQESTCTLQGFTRNFLHNFTALKMLCESSIIVPLFTSFKETQFIVYTPRDKEDFGQIQVVQVAFKLKADGQEKVTSTVIRTIQFDDADLINTSDHPPFVSLTRNLDEAIFLISKKNIHKVEVQQETVKTWHDVNISGIQMLDNNHCYAIVNNQSSTKNQVSGLKYFTLDMLMMNLQTSMLEIDVTVTGPYSGIEFSKENERLTYLKTYDVANIIPILNRSTINYMGMLPRSNYLAFKKKQNQLFALDRNNRITVWNVLTGKHISIHHLQGVDYSQFKIFGLEQNDKTYLREWYQPMTLIVETHEEFDQFEYQKFSQQKISNEIEKGRAYVHNENFKYHLFKLIEIESESTVKEHQVFVHQHYNDKFQRLYISEDRQLMIERLVNLRVLVYQSEMESDGYTKWHIIKRFENFPYDLSELSESLFMFSKDLKRYINFDKVQGLFFIRNTIGYEKIKVPKEYMNPTLEDPLNVIKRVKWVGNDQLMICNDWGLEKLIKIDYQKETFTEISSLKIPAFQQLLTFDHIYEEPTPLDLGAIVHRLLRKYRDIQRRRIIFNKDFTIQIYEELFQVDYNVNNGYGKLVSDLSFSYISWKIIEEICKEKDPYDIKLFDTHSLMMLSLNILPGCQTILHKLSKKSAQLLHILQNVPIYQLSSPDYEHEFEMPFILNLKNKTALHICYENKEFKSADNLIKYLSDAPIDHHGRAIQDILPDLVRKELPSLQQYFDNRLLTTPQLKKVGRGQLKKYQENLDLAFTTQSLWASDNLKKEIFIENDKNDKKLKPIMSDVELKFLDLPNFHYLNQKVAKDFFNALKETEDLQLFELKSIRFLVDYLWPIIKQQTRKRLLIPFVFYLITYWVYTNFVYEFYYTGGAYGIQILWTNLSLLVLFSLYFLFYEFKQILSSKGYEYFFSPWNYIDLTPPVIMISQAILNFIPLQDEGQNWVSSIQAVGSLFMWLKLLYFFRINKDTAYLIRMIAKVIGGMRTFLGVLLITIVAFGDAFISLKKVKEPLDDDYSLTLSNFLIAIVSRFVISCFFVYKMILGDVSVDDFDDTHKLLAGFLVVFCTLFVMIIMLNLLISIIGQVYGQVQENQINEFYQEKATIIAENSYLIPKNILSERFKPGKYLLIAKKVGEEVASKDEEQENDKEQRQMNKFLDEMREIIDQKFKAFEQRHDGQQSTRSQFKLKKTF